MKNAQKRISVQSLGAEIPVWALRVLLARYLDSRSEDGPLKEIKRSLRRGACPAGLHGDGWVSDTFAALSQDLRLSHEEYDQARVLVFNIEED